MHRASTRNVCQRQTRNWHNTPPSASCCCRSFRAVRANVTNAMHGPAVTHQDRCHVGDIGLRTTAKTCQVPVSCALHSENDRIDKPHTRCLATRRKLFHCPDDLSRLRRSQRHFLVRWTESFYNRLGLRISRHDDDKYVDTRHLTGEIFPGTQASSLGLSDLLFVDIYPTTSIPLLWIWRAISKPIAPIPTTQLFTNLPNYFFFSITASLRSILNLSLST